MRVSLRIRLHTDADSLTHALSLASESRHSWLDEKAWTRGKAAVEPSWATERIALFGPDIDACLGAVLETLRKPIAELRSRYSTRVSAIILMEYDENDVPRSVAIDESTIRLLAELDAQLVLDAVPDCGQLENSSAT